MDTEPYDEFFSYWNGGGGAKKGVGRIFFGSPHQRGHGHIGSFLAGIFRRVCCQAALKLWAKRLFALAWTCIWHLKTRP